MKYIKEQQQELRKSWLEAHEAIRADLRKAKRELVDAKIPLEIWTRAQEKEANAQMLEAIQAYQRTVQTGPDRKTLEEIELRL